MTLRLSTATTQILRRRQLIQIPWVFLITVGLLAAFNLKVLSTHNWDPMAFVLKIPEEAEFGIRETGVGYDGQFSYVLASQPLGTVAGLDQPGYRYQRILYPLLVRLLSLGIPGWTPWAMLALNLAAAGFGCAGLGRLLRKWGASPWLALVWIFSLGYLLTIRMDLLEPMALALALWGWIAYEEDWPSLAITLFALSGLTKEVGLVFPAGLALAELLQRNTKRSAGLLLGSLAPYASWYLTLNLRFGASETQMAQSALILVPFWGLRFLESTASRLLVGIWVLAPACLAGLAALVDLWRIRDADRQRNDCLLLAQVALVATMPAPTWEDPLAIFRIGLGLLATLLVWLAASKPRLLPVAAALWAPSSLVMLLVPRML